MRIFYAFLIMFIAVVMWLLPITTLVYDFRTDQATEYFNTITGVGITSSNITLGKQIYGADTGTFDVSSNNSADTPDLGAYNHGSHSANVTGLSANSTHYLTVTYDYEAVSGSTAITSLLDRVAYIWLILIIALPVAAIAAIFIRR